MDISVEGLSHSYHSRNGAARVALRGLDLQLSGPILYGVLGPNGGGKSTLFRILATMLRPTSGRARVAGFDVVEQAHEVRRHLGVVFQTNSLDRQLTVEENLRCQGELQGVSTLELPGRIDEVLQQMDLVERRTSCACSTTSKPATRARPDVGFSMVARMRNNVDLPPPLGPSTPYRIGPFSCKSSPRKATRAAPLRL